MKLLLAFSGIALVGIGCSSSGSRPAVQATPAPRAGLPTAAPTIAATSAPAAGPVQGLRISLDGTSEVRYRAHEVLVRLRVPSEAVGKTNQVTGAIVIDAAGRLIPAESNITADLRQLQSDERLRDRFIRDETLQTGRFPNAEFAAKEIRGLPWPAPTPGELKFQLVGDLTVHGVMRPVTWDVVASVSGTDVVATATTQTRITEFGMLIPRVLTVVSIEDEITLEVETKTRLN